MRLKNDVIQFIRDNQPVKPDIQKAMSINEKTLYNWLKQNNVQLLDDKCLKVIAIHKNCATTDLYETSPEMQRWNAKQEVKRRNVKLSHATNRQPEISQ